MGVYARRVRVCVHANLSIALILKRIITRMKLFQLCEMTKGSREFCKFIIIYPKSVINRLMRCSSFGGVEGMDFADTATTFVEFIHVHAPAHVFVKCCATHLLRAVSSLVSGGSVAILLLHRFNTSKFTKFCKWEDTKDIRFLLQSNTRRLVGRRKGK